MLYLKLFVFFSNWVIRKVGICSIFFLRKFVKILFDLIWFDFVIILLFIMEGFFDFGDLMDFDCFFKLFVKEEKEKIFLFRNVVGYMFVFVSFDFIIVIFL